MRKVLTTFFLLYPIPEYGVAYIYHMTDSQPWLVVRPTNPVVNLDLQRDLGMRSMNWTPFKFFEPVASSSVAELCCGSLEVIKMNPSKRYEDVNDGEVDGCLVVEFLIGVIPSSYWFA